MSPDIENSVIDPAEPALSPDFAARVLRRVQAERKRRVNRRRASIAAACAVSALLAIYFIQGRSAANLQPQDETVAANESPAEPPGGWPLGWETANQTVGGYFFPDLGSMTSYYTESEGGAGVSFDSMLGFDQDAGQVLDVSGS